MPEKQTIEKAQRKKREGKTPSTQAGEFVREEMHHIRQGKHGARSAKQAIAIGLSKARKAGVRLKSYGKKGKQASAASSKKHSKPSPTRSRASSKALKREPHSAASHRALSRQSRAAQH